MIFLSGDVDNISVIALSSTDFIVAYRKDPTTGTRPGRLRLGIVSGTTITLDIEKNIGANVGDLSATALSTTKFVVAYTDSDDSDHGTAKVYTVTGTSIASGSEFEFNSAGNSAPLDAAALSATKFVVVYRDAADLNHGTAKVGTVTGTNIAFSEEGEFQGTAGADEPSVVALSASKFAVAYRDNGDANHGTAKVGVLSNGASLNGANLPYASAVGATRLAFSGWTRVPSA